MLFESTAHEFEQLRGRLEVDFGTEHILMPKICDNKWQLGMNINALLHPARETMHCERVPQLVRPCPLRPVDGLSPWARSSRRIAAEPD
jgi:hypothetical protein